MFHNWASFTVVYNFYPYLIKENNHMFGILVADPNGHHLINTIDTSQRHM